MYISRNVKFHSVLRLWRIMLLPERILLFKNSGGDFIPSDTVSSESEAKWF